MQVVLSKSLWALMVLCCMLCACNHKTAGIKNYLQYVNDAGNGLVQEKEVDGLVFRLKYITPEWMALNELKKTNINEDEWQRTLEEYKGLAYCKMTVSAKDKQHIYRFLQEEGFDEQEVEAYFNYDAQNDVFMLQSEDTAKCVLYSFSKTYGLSQQFDIALAFEPITNGNNSDRVIDFDASLFNRGALKFRFKQNDLENIPTLTL